jgi:uncharacterized protein
MMSTRNRYVVAIWVLVAVAAGGVSAAAFFAKGARGSDPTIAFTKAAATPSPTILVTTSSSQQNTITVVGSGTATGVPDEALLGIGVQATRPTVRDSLSVAAGDMNRLLSSLHHQGVKDKDIQTSSISVYQQTNCCPQYVTGYVSSNMLSVTVHHLANVSPIIEAAVAAVGNDIQLNGVSLSIGDPSALVKTARAAAMSDANARAQVWAGLSHHHVGQILALSEIIAAPPAYECVGCGKGSAGGGGGTGGVTIAAGQSDVSVTITAVYELLT